MCKSVELIFPEGKAESQRASYETKAGRYTRVRNGIYVNSTDAKAVQEAVSSGWQRIVAHLTPPGSVLAFRSAVDLAPASGEVFVVCPVKRRRKVVVGEYLIVHILPGDTSTGVHPVDMNLQMSGEARKCLENLAPTSGRRVGIDKAKGPDWVQNHLARLAVDKGEAALNSLRDEARDIAPTLNMGGAFDTLDTIITAILNTHDAPQSVLSDRLALAKAQGDPFDEHVLTRFEELRRYLDRCELEAVAGEYDRAAWRNLSLIEAYFSNYIEGTEFTIEEAEDIVFNRSVNHDRPADSHDLLATYDLTSDRQEMLLTPGSPDELLRLIQRRHHQLMQARAEHNPGQFKTRQNRAGGTDFVIPEKLIGTLTRAYSIYEDLPMGLSRALFIHFAIAECHPMSDGNGHVSRLFMNAELHRADLAKIIIPTAHRDSYLNGLRRASRENTFRTLVKAMHQMHLYSASLPWRDYDDLRARLAAHKADHNPDEALSNFNHAIRPFAREYPVDTRIAGIAQNRSR